MSWHIAVPVVTSVNHLESPSIYLFIAVWPKSRWSISPGDSTNIQDRPWQVQWVGTWMDKKICHVVICTLVTQHQTTSNFRNILKYINNYIQFVFLCFYTFVIVKLLLCNVLYFNHLCVNTLQYIHYKISEEKTKKLIFS